MIQLIFNLHAYWHAGTSRGQGPALNALVAKDRFGCPYLPGRTVKGLVRDAVQRAEHWNQVSQGLTNMVFGRDAQSANLTRFESEEAALAFDSAVCPPEVTESLAKDPQKGISAYFYDQIYATAIDPQSGCATPKSLRGMEVSIPLRLKALVTELVPGTLANHYPEWQEEIAACLPLIRGLGASRTRGLGRCSVSMEECKA